MPEDLVTIEQFQFLPQAEAARMRLEAEGIRTFLADAETVNMDWLLGNAIGYIKLQVPCSQAQAARSILDNHRAELSPQGRRAGLSDAGTCLACGAQLADNQERCPECGWSYAEGGEAAEQETAEDAADQPEAAAQQEPGWSPGPMQRLRSWKRRLFLFLLLWPLLGLGSTLLLTLFFADGLAGLLVGLLGGSIALVLILRALSHR
jgi:hypothetical protein